MSDNNYLIEECRYCGNKTKLDIVGSYLQNSNFEDDYQWCKNWLLLRCCCCGEVSLGYKYSGEDTIHYENNETEYDEIYETCFPVETYNGLNVPENIHKAFLAALKSRYTDNMICLMALRRTIEKICKEKNAVGKDLKGKILDLAGKNVFPEMIKTASNILRILGNDAAHGDDVEYDERTVNEMINFTQIIIEYVYVIPYRLNKIKNKLNLQKI